MPNMILYYMIGPWEDQDQKKIKIFEAVWIIIWTSQILKEMSVVSYLLWLPIYSCSNI